ncbi:MAG: hypothetical protein LH615_13575 [Ferruginibacter sp.]|nr:hypothetical protein [Ferruginibacter sp.]
MFINRNNYETFFLLYADNELRVNERKGVEDFVNENKDLKPELQMLMAAILPAEEIVLADKSFLYRDITFDATLQEKLLLKIDEELSATELENVNNILATDKEALQEYNSLLGTKLSVDDKIVFELKHLLYKKEKDNVVAFGWVRSAAAAVLIGFGLFLGITIFNKKEIEISPVAVIKIPENNSTKQISTVIDSKNSTVAKTSTNTKTNNNKAVLNQNIEQDNMEIVKKERTKNIVKEKNVNNNNSATEEMLAVNKITEKTLAIQKIIIKEETAQAIATLKSTIKNKTVLIEDNIVPLENTYAKVASFTDEEKSENKIFYMDEEDVKRSKIGGFFKKVKRLVERTANIKTGNSISIAGFEITSK